MKKCLFGAGIFLASSFVAFAGALNTKGVPASAAGVVHIDFDAVSKSKIGQTVKENSNASIPGEPDANLLAELKKELTAGGVSLEDIADLTVALVPRKEGEPETVILVRGKFDPAKIADAAKKENLKAITIGEHTFFVEKLKSEKQPKGGLKLDSDVYFSPLDANTLLLAENKTIAAAALDAFSGKAKSYTAPSSLSAYGKVVGTPFVLVYVNGKIFPKQAPAKKNAEPDALSLDANMTPPNPAHLFFALGEDTKNFKTRLAMTYANAADVQKTQAIAQMMLGMVAMFTNPAGPDGKPDPKKAADAAKINKIVSSLKITTAEPNYLIFSLDYPVDEIVSFLKEAAPAQNNAATADK
ncbi:MAG: hypothetical protein LBS59_04220 [Puniceicoccales bacterium]|jgi:hypothetical protein|nr:hypothetical protein [Puniceicoccales bacterium]